jgi:hypothetical protein
MQTHERVDCSVEEVDKVISKDLIHNVHELQAACNSGEASWASQKFGGKERVSFDTNMLTEEEVLDGRLVEQKPQVLMIVVEQFHVRKFKVNPTVKTET